MPLIYSVNEVLSTNLWYIQCIWAKQTDPFENSTADVFPFSDIDLDKNYFKLGFSKFE